MDKIKKISILGSTGSIGTSTLKVLDEFKNKFKVHSLTAFQNIELLKKQIKKYKPKIAVLADPSKKLKLKNIKIYKGKEYLKKIVRDKAADIIVIGIVGEDALEPVFEAVRTGKKICLANKECIVMAGDYLFEEAKKYKSEIIPVDSEHSALYQCIGKLRDSSEVRKIILTASGGPFFREKLSEIKKATVEDALKHPTWKMGAKITIDSATLMNKALEIIEAGYLYNISYKNIDVIIHPSSIIHSFVEFIDGSTLAQMSYPDMVLPIQYALGYPERLKNKFPSLAFDKIKKLEFYKADRKKFPSIDFALEALKRGGIYPLALNAANDIAVEAFIKGKIKFFDIFKINEYAFSLKGRKENNLEKIIQLNKQIKEKIKSKFNL